MKRRGEIEIEIAGVLGAVEALDILQFLNIVCFQPCKASLVN